MSELPSHCGKCGQLLPPTDFRDLTKELNAMRRKYNQLHSAAKAVSENFQLYDSNINVTVAMDLIEKLQQRLNPNERIQQED